jgi:hypothetical protein
MSPVRYDDSINIGTRAALAREGTSLGESILFWTGQWMTNEGRFFPGSVAWTQSLFYFFDSRVEYKLVLVAVSGFAIAAAMALVWFLSRHLAASAITGLALLAVLQVRAYDVGDGLTAFTGLLPLTTGLTLAACAIVVRTSLLVWSIMAGALYLLAMFTYETVFLFAPAMIALVLVATRSWRRVLPLAIPAVIELVIVLILRTSVGSNTAPAYTMSLEALPVLRTLGKQLVAAIPLSQWWLGSTPAMSIPLIGLCLVLLGVPVFISALSLTRISTKTPRSVLLVTAGLGLWMWLTSAALIAVTVRWQVELPRGQGYLGTVYEYFGLALCVVAGWLAINERLAAPGRSEKLWLAWSYGSSGAVAVVVALTAAGNLSVTG